MVKDIRVTYRKRHSYNTPSNRVRVVKSPGGRLLAHNLRKRAGVPKCGDTGKALHGIPRARPKAFARLPQHKRTVSRAYGGNLSHAAVRERILRAFIVEEQKIVKKVLTEKAKSSKAAKGSKGASSKGSSSKK